MAKFIKRFWIVLLSFVLIPLSFFGFGAKSQAQGSNDYVKNTIMVDSNGKVTVSLIMSCTLSNEYNIIQKGLFNNELSSLLDIDLAEKQAKITAKYLEESNKEYNPEEVIEFVKTGISNNKEYLGYKVIYKNYKVFEYYNDVKLIREEGFFMDRYNLEFNNPFDDDYQQGQTVITYAEKCKNMFITALKSIKNDANTSYYAPYYYNDYMTLRHRAKSSTTVFEDENGYFHHVWVNDETSLSSAPEMKMTYNLIHSGWWYLLGISVPLIVMGVVIVVVKIKQMKKFKNRS